MPRTIFLIPLYFFLLKGLGQTTFNTTTINTSYKHDILETKNGDIFIAGQQTYTDGGSPYLKNRLVRLDRNGVLLWDTIYTYTSSNEFDPKLIETKEGGCFLISESHSFPTPESSASILVLKIDLEGNVLFEAHIPALSLYDAIVTSNGDNLILTSDYKDGYFAGILAVYNINDDGSIKWVSEFADQVTEPFSSLMMGGKLREIDGSYFVTGYLFDIPYKHGRLYKLSTDGLVIWEQRIDGDDIEPYKEIESVFKLRENFYFNSEAGRYTFDFLTGAYKQVTDTIYLWTSPRSYNYAAQCDILTNITQVNDSFYLNQSANICEISYTKFIQNINGDLIAYLPTHDGGHVVTTKRDSTLQVVKVDCRGNNYWSDDCNSKIIPGNELVIYPNPAQAELQIVATFDFNEAFIYSANGEMAQYTNTCFCPRITIDVSTLAAGVYTVRISDENQSAISRFVKI